MGEFIARLRESASPVGEDDAVLSNRGKPPPPPPPQNPVEELPGAVTVPEIVRPVVVPDASVEEDRRRKLPAVRRVAEEARLRQAAKERVEHAPQAVEESYDEFTQSRTGDDLFNDDQKNDEPVPRQDAPSASRGEDHRAPSARPPNHTGRRRLAIPARHHPYQRPGEADQLDRPLTEINLQRPEPSHTPTALEDQTPPAIPPIDLAPTEPAPNRLVVPKSDQEGIERRRKAAQIIRQQRPPARPPLHEQANDVVIFRVWTGVRWTERSRIVVDRSDPLCVEREAKRFIENYHAQLRDARMRNLMPSQCLQSARQDGSHLVFMIFPDDKTVTEAMAKAAAEFINPRPNRH